MATYLTRIAINLSLNEIKKRKRGRLLSLDKMIEEGTDIAGPENLKESLGLTESQAKKVDNIFLNLRQKMDKLREREYAVIKSYRDSTKKLLNDSYSEMLKVLNKNRPK